ncbi:relaxase/mobilization nuclease domain-containing protein [Streptococcus dysgalactiae]|uniref:helical hairpin domain-containing protein n=1 Tax=Streptococcus dysgalactiae TaxID=1334 RepID=UPI000DFE132F|nr:relaxase/mobilization nuclease domain-containing protein [Streptococcus dysgalactiae]QQT04034.1 relaxase/mobilization nuclease domain-containing protein [Streptococcus dysgalactiae]SUN46114.1 putative truncated relaxase [Streptococcus dysgalactiae subsp. dysgalactiae]SUN50952.1 putative truncated relaxase [Streptococcus dysgalactiae]VDZ39875.1 putative truncated relaxase [Streptococcus dysgalactiae subsp. dysgalactiae]
MVVTKVFQIKQTKNLKRAIDYITRDDATLMKVEQHDEDDAFDYTLTVDGEVHKKLISGHHLIDSSDRDAIYDDFILLKQSVDDLYDNDTLSDLKNDNRVLAHHIVQSFSPDDNLTPEEVNEIGRKTALEFTGGDYQFVVATHVDKGFLHNHIIFNTTNEVTLKKFRWQKGTKKSLEHISDKYAELYGAKILEPKLRNSYTDYSAWRRQHNFRFEIKERLDFLIRHSLDKQDLLQKAKALNLQIDTNGKYVTYRLADQPQQRPVRDRTLSKKGKYSLEKVEERLSFNEVVYNLDNIKEKYNEEQAKKAEDFEMKVIIEPWQISRLTTKSIHVPITFGLDRQGTVSISARMLDQNEDGTFTAYLKKNDFFYFLNADHSEQNRFIKGTTLIKQLASQNGEVILTKNSQISKLDQLVEEFNFLAINKVTNSKQFQEMQERFLEQLEATDKTLTALDDKIAYLNKVLGALSDYQDELIPSVVTMAILEKAKVSSATERHLIRKEIKELQIERETLLERRNRIVTDYDFANEMEERYDHKYHQSKTRQR